MVTLFAPVTTSLDDLQAKLDRFKPSGNIFIGIRIDGTFTKLNLRTACKAHPGEGLAQATSHQSVFERTHTKGTLVGFWTPIYAKTINVPGYYLHFIDEDRKYGGHLLDVTAKDVKVALHIETDFHMTIPETEGFLSADLTVDPTKDLDKAEKSRS